MNREEQIAVENMLTYIDQLERRVHDLEYDGMDIIESRKRRKDEHWKLTQRVKALEAENARLRETSPLEILSQVESWGNPAPRKPGTIPLITPRSDGSFSGDDIHDGCIVAYSIAIHSGSESVAVIRGQTNYTGTASEAESRIRLYLSTFSGAPPPEKKASVGLDIPEDLLQRALEHYAPYAEKSKRAQTQKLNDIFDTMIYPVIKRIDNGIFQTRAQKRRLFGQMVRLKFKSR